MEKFPEKRRVVRLFQLVSGRIRRVQKVLPSERAVAVGDHDLVIAIPTSRSRRQR